MPKTAKPLEVTRFVWERERLYDNRKPRPWTAWWKQWNDEHPEDGFKTASNFRTYFVRGKEAVEHLNFDWPDVKPCWKPGAIATASLDTMRQAGEENTA
jgi:hypothetical protein